MGSLWTLVKAVYFNKQKCNNINNINCLDHLKNNHKTFECNQRTLTNGNN